MPQSADWFDPLLGAADLDEVTQRIFTLIVEPVDDDKALAELRSAAARHGGEQEAAREGRTRWDPFKARKAGAVTAREQEVAAGAAAVGYTGLVVVTVADGDSLGAGRQGGAAPLPPQPGAAAPAVGPHGARRGRRPCRSVSACRGSRSDGPAAVTRVPPPPPASSRRRLALPRHRSTTAQVCAIYPAVVQAPLPQFGPLLGDDLSAGYGPLCWDPFEGYEHGLVTNPNVFVMGEPGFSKSSLIKCWAVVAALPVRGEPLVDDHRPERRVPGRGGADRDDRDAARARRRRPDQPAGVPRRARCRRRRSRAEDRAVQALALYALAGVVLERRLRPLERKAVRSVVDVVADRRGTAPPTLLDVLGLLAAPDRRAVPGHRPHAPTSGCVTSRTSASPSTSCAPARCAACSTAPPTCTSTGPAPGW